MLIITRAKYYKEKYFLVMINGQNTSLTTGRVNKSYLDVDYFMMMPGSSPQSISHNKTFNNNSKNKFSFFL